MNRLSGCFMKRDAGMRQLRPYLQSDFGDYLSIVGVC